MWLQAASWRQTCGLACGAAVRPDPRDPKLLPSVCGSRSHFSQDWDRPPSCSTPHSTRGRSCPQNSPSQPSRALAALREGGSYPSCPPQTHHRSLQKLSQAKYPALQPGLRATTDTEQPFSARQDGCGLRHRWVPPLHPFPGRHRCRQLDCRQVTAESSRNCKEHPAGWKTRWSCRTPTYRHPHGLKSCYLRKATRAWSQTPGCSSSEDSRHLLHLMDMPCQPLQRPLAHVTSSFCNDQRVGVLARE